MKSPVVFRGTFVQPIGALNPSGWKIGGPVEVEIYHSLIGPPSEWRARRTGTLTQFKITPQSSPHVLMAQLVGIYFETQVGEWQAFDSSQVPARLLQRGADWNMVDNGKIVLTEDYRERMRDELRRKPAPGVTPIAQ